MAQPLHEFNNLFRRLVAFKSIDSLQHDLTLGKSLGCYMVKPHGQLVLVS